MKIHLFFLFLFRWCWFLFFLSNLFLLRWTWDRRYKLNLPTTLGLNSLDNLHWIRFLTFHNNLVSFAVSCHTFNSWEILQTATNFPSTAFTMHKHFQYNLRRRRSSSRSFIFCFLRFFLRLGFFFLCFLFFLNKINKTCLESE